MGILGRPLKPLHGHLPVLPLLPVTSHWKELYRYVIAFNSSLDANQHSVSF